MKLPTPTDLTSTGPVLDPATLEELRRLARSRPRSGRQWVAKASAIRTLERLARERRRQPMPPMPDGWCPHVPGDPFYELDWVFLHEHPRSCGAIGSWRGARGECEWTVVNPARRWRRWVLTGSRGALSPAGATSGPLHGIPADALGTSPSSDVDKDRHGRR
jgi:hypothetical protein